LTSADKGGTISVVACCSAEGYFLPPVCIFKGVNKKQEFEDGLPPGSAVIMSKKSALVTSEAFMTWLKDHFLPRKPSGQVFIVLGGNSSHVSDIDILGFVNENDIVILCLPRHSTPYLQPLDRSFFKSLKLNFHEACQTWIMSKETQKIIRLHFGLLAKAWRTSATTVNGVSGFETTGIHPFDPSAIPEHAFSMFKRHVNDEAGQLQPETDSPQSVQGESTASTSGEHVGLESHESGSCEMNTHVNTPRKILLKISLIPEIPQGKDSKRKQSTAVLTSKDCLAKKRQKFIIKEKPGNA
jgi:hypothetical protein